MGGVGESVALAEEETEGGNVECNLRLMCLDTWSSLASAVLGEP